MTDHFDELFEKRGMIGAVIEREMENAGINKSRLCRETGISRPTLDKLLNGEITNKTNFDKHITKIFQTLKIRPENLLKKNIKIRAARSRMRLSQDYVSKATNIPIQRLKEIEAGEEVLPEE